MFDYYWDCYFVILLASFHQFINTKTHLIVCGTLSLFFIEIYWHPKLNKVPKEIKRAQASTKKALFYCRDTYGTHFLILRLFFCLKNWKSWCTSKVWVSETTTFEMFKELNLSCCLTCPFEWMQLKMNFKVFKEPASEWPN